MVVKIEIQNPCSCVKKRKSWMKELLFDTLEEAEKIAFEMCIQGNTKFCKKHTFEKEISDGQCIIKTLKAVK